MSLFHLPDLGEGLGEAEIVAWHVGVGDHVVTDQPLLSVETDKAVVEIPSPRAGRIAALHGAPGDIVQVGGALVEFSTTSTARDSETVVGSLPHPKREPGVPRARPGRASPAVRALAARQGVDLATLRGSGPDGTITRADVEQACGTAMSGTVTPLRGVRRSMARNMSRAHAEVVPATLTDTADIDGWTPGTDVTLRLVRAITVGCAAEPALNAWFLGVDQGRRLHQSVDVGIAAETEEGLFVPVLRDAGNRVTEDLRRGLDRLKAELLTRGIPEQELRGPTITLSNFGMFGGEHAALVVLPPQVAILGAGRARERVVAREGKGVVRRVLPLSLTFDHRAVTGAEAARFMKAVAGDLAGAS